jgi:hypothetical protein
VLSSLSPYELRETDKGYEFTTDSGVDYEVYFFKSNYFSLVPEITVPILELQLGPIGSLPIGRSLLDSRIGDTVVSLVQGTLRDGENAIIYICDNTDSREEKRMKKFNRWYDRFNEGDIIMVAGEIDAGDYTVFSSLLIHNQNSQLAIVISAFEELNNPDMWKSPSIV